VKAVIIGAGRMGRRHVEVVRAAGIDLAGVADRSSEALALAERENAVPRAGLYRDVGRMLAETRPDCVIVATTAPSHAEYVHRSVEAGAQCILCEKPLGVSIGDCDRMIRLCRERGVALAVNHQMRFMEQYVEPKRLVESEEFGGLSSVTVVAGNFGLAMNGTHYFEMFRFLAGESPARVRAWFSPDKVPNPRGREFEDRAGAVQLSSQSGKRFYMDASADQGHGVQVVYAGPYGVLTVDELAGRARMVVRKPEHRAMPTTRYGMPWEERRFEMAPADVIQPSRAVLEALLRRSDYPTGEDGRAAVAVLVAAHLSDERGGDQVNVDETLPKERLFPWA